MVEDGTTAWPMFCHLFSPKNLRKLTQAICNRMDRGKIMKEHELWPGGDIRILGNQWLRAAFAAVNDKLLGGNRNLIHDKKTKNPRIQSSLEWNQQNSPQQSERDQLLFHKKKERKKKRLTTPKQISNSIKGPTSVQADPSKTKGNNYPSTALPTAVS